MPEKPIKVDEKTDRLVTDLAHFLRSTKKSIVREAVAEYAEARHALMPAGAGGVRTPAAERNRAASERNDRSGGGSVESVGGNAETGSGDITGLVPMQRLGLRRNELIREFARQRGTNVRVLQASPEDGDDEITLLVDTDVIDGGAAASRLQEIARRLLATDVTVVSMTGLRLMRPERYRSALERSDPL